MKKFFLLFTISFLYSFNILKSDFLEELHILQSQYINTKKESHTNTFNIYLKLKMGSEEESRLYPELQREHRQNPLIQDSVDLAIFKNNLITKQRLFNTINVDLIDLFKNLEKNFGKLELLNYLNYKKMDFYEIILNKLIKIKNRFNLNLEIQDQQNLESKINFLSEELNYFFKTALKRFDISFEHANQVIEPAYKEYLSITREIIFYNNAYEDLIKKLTINFEVVV